MAARIIAKCRHCGIEIGQGPSGAGVPTDRDNILGVCRKGRVGQPLMLHEPMPAGLEGAAVVVDRDEPPWRVVDVRDDSPWRSDD